MGKWCRCSSINGQMSFSRWWFFLCWCFRRLYNVICNMSTQSIWSRRTNSTPSLHTVQQNTKKLQEQSENMLMITSIYSIILYSHSPVAAEKLLFEVLHALCVEPIHALAALQHIVIKFASFTAIAINFLLIHAMFLIPAQLVHLCNNTRQLVSNY